MFSVRSSFLSGPFIKNKKFIMRGVVEKNRKKSIMFYHFVRLLKCLFFYFSTCEKEVWCYKYGSIPTYMVYLYHRYMKQQHTIQSSNNNNLSGMKFFFCCFFWFSVCCSFFGLDSIHMQRVCICVSDINVGCTIPYHV